MSGFGCKTIPDVTSESLGIILLAEESNVVINLGGSTLMIFVDSKQGFGVAS
jgi:hypothetical protein